MSFATGWGFQFLAILNLFAFRTVSPAELKLSPEPVGSENDKWISEISSQSGRIVVCWGKNGKHLGRDLIVLNALKGNKLWCFGRNSDGTPKHPLYIPKNKELEPYAP
jgi:hypothetical protein